MLQQSTVNGLHYDMAKPTTAATTQQAVRAPTNGPPRLRANAAAVAAAMAEKVPTFNRLRSKPGWYGAQVHVLRGLQPRKARLPACTKRVHDLWEDRAFGSSVLVEGQRATSKGEGGYDYAKTGQGSDSRAPVRSSTYSDSPAVVLPRVWRRSEKPTVQMPCKGMPGEETHSRPPPRILAFSFSQRP